MSIDEEFKAMNEGKKEVLAEAKGEGFLGRDHPSLPTFFVASSMILPIALGQDRRNRALDVVEGI